MSNSENAKNGLATWCARQAEEKRLKMLELAHYRADATTEDRDGRTYTLIRIPDRYDFTARPKEPRVQLRKNRKRA